MPVMKNKKKQEVAKTAELPMAFVTGSRAYGIPRDDSDIDLVVLLSKKSYYKLADQTKFSPNDHPSASEEESCPSLRFGVLNIIPCFEPELFEAWKKGTELLVDEAPVSKKRAIAVLEELRQAAKVKVINRKRKGYK